MSAKSRSGPHPTEQYTNPSFEQECNPADTATGTGTGGGGTVTGVVPATGLGTASGSGSAVGDVDTTHRKGHR